MRPEAQSAGVIDAVERASPGARIRANDGPLLTLELTEPLPQDAVDALLDRPEVAGVRQVKPVYLAPRSGASKAPLFSSGQALLSLAAERGVRLCDLALAYEAGRLGWTPPEIRSRAGRMISVMRAARDRGLSEDLPLGGGIVKQGGRR
jgi:hypothetical protein